MTTELMKTTSNVIKRVLNKAIFTFAKTAPKSFREWL